MQKVNQLKILAANAKQRMKNGYWQKAKQERTEVVKKSESMGKDPKLVENIMVNKMAREMNAAKNVLVKSEEDLYQKVCKILDDNVDVRNPIALLIDKKTYNNLSPMERQRYVMVLIFKYGELKERYVRERLKANVY